MARLFKIAILFILFTPISQLNAGEFSPYNSDPENSPQDTINPPSKNSEKTKTRRFFNDLENKVNQNSWSRQLYNIVIVPSEKKQTDTIEAERSDLDYLQYEGLIIRNIDFIRLNPFGTSIQDTSRYSASWINRTGNALHVTTQERILRRNLLMKKNDIIDAEVLSDNERVIRDLSYIDDVRIVVSPDTLDPGYADITVITRDVWSKAFFPELKEVDAGKVEIYDRNIFGIGNEFQSNIHWDPRKSDFWGYEAFYKNKNILGSFIDSRIYFRNVFETQSYGAEIDRKFVTPSTRYAFGGQIYKLRSQKWIWFSDSLRVLEPYHLNYADAWLGRAIPLRSSDILDYKRLNLTIASRIIYSKHFERPAETADRLLYEFHDKTLWLSSLSISAQSYYRSNLIYSYGRTEDIPNGWLANFTFGKEFSEFDDRWYSSLNLSHGNYINFLGYFYAGTSIGGFINSKKSFEQGLFQFELNYFTKLFILGQFKFRHFAYINYIMGLNRFPLENLNINDRNGIRGLSTNSIYGQKKLVFNLESVMFSPYKLYGFNFVFFGFADIAIIGEEDVPFSKLDEYAGIGFGLRVRNERLVFPTFQFRFAFYPNIDDVLFEDHFKFSGEKKLRPKDFITPAPRLLEFR